MVSFIVVAKGWGGGGGDPKREKRERNTHNSFLQIHSTIFQDTTNHTKIIHPVNTHPRIFNPSLSNALPSCSVAVTSAVLGNTNENHVIWNCNLLLPSGRKYFHSEPTDTKKNQQLSPHSQIPAMYASTLNTVTAASPSMPRKLAGIKSGAELASWTSPAAVKAPGPMEMNTPGR